MKSSGGIAGDTSVVLFFLHTGDNFSDGYRTSVLDEDVTYVICMND